MNTWMKSGFEPALDEMFEEPIVRALMDRDRTDRDSVTELLRRADYDCQSTHILAE